MILFSKYLVPKGYSGMAVFPFIFVNDKQLSKNRVFINHEKIHLQQQIELLVFPFYVWYGLEFLIKLYAYRNWHLAYKNISFEREAYTHEMDLEYLKHRGFWRFLKYLRNHEF